MRSAMFAALAMSFVGACSVALDFDDRTPKGTPDASASSSSSGSSGASSGTSGTTSSSGSSATDADVPADGSTSDAPSGSCPSSGGPTMVKTGTLCIDSTEVTKGQYAAFLATTPPTTGQVAGCSGNASFTPVSGWPGQAAEAVVGIDWCDAVAFCTWAKKKLCTDTQWSAACNAAVPGLTAMPDGQQEWVDDCTADNCRTRGVTGCGATVMEARMSTHEDVGFRCCSQ